MFQNCGLPKNYEKVGSWQGKCVKAGDLPLGSEELVTWLAGKAYVWNFGLP